MDEKTKTIAEIFISYQIPLEFREDDETPQPECTIQS